MKSKFAEKGRLPQRSCSGPRFSAERFFGDREMILLGGGLGLQLLREDAGEGRVFAELQRSGSEMEPLCLG